MITAQEIALELEQHMEDAGLRDYRVIAHADSDNFRKLIFVIRAFVGDYSEKDLDRYFAQYEEPLGERVLTYWLQMVLDDISKGCGCVITSIGFNPHAQGPYGEGVAFQILLQSSLNTFKSRYVDKHGDVVPEQLIDDIERQGVIPGETGSGRSDEYLHYIYEEDTAHGYMTVVLYIRIDDWEHSKGTIASNIEVSLVVNVDESTPVNEEVLGYVGGDMLGRPYDSGVIVNGDYVSSRRLPEGSSIEGLYYDFGAVNTLPLQGDEIYNPVLVAEELASDMNDAIDEAREFIETI